MASNNNNNRVLVPQARAGLNTFKEEVASEIGLANYAEADKGNLTSRQNGYVGGIMVKKMVESYEQKL
ncbi:MAG: alpha/beta-type small acid-soluble spore protein [Bacillota bacterium]|nr:alpha/beta-type small acid-soluble spore protein [Bacillota bacterium]